MSTATELEPLKATEKKTLVACENTIERGMKSFIEVGNALSDIRDARLYRESHGTFESYCKDRWGFTRMRASQLITSAEAAENVKHVLQSDDAPANERQAHELASLDEPEDQAAAWERANEIAEEREAPVTASIVSEAVAEIVEPEPEPEEIEDDEPSVMTDYEDNEVPEHARVIFEDDYLIDDAARSASELGNAIKSLGSSPLGKLAPLAILKKHVREIKKALKDSRPYSVCPYCSGKKCTACAETGIVTQLVYEQSK